MRWKVESRAAKIQRMTSQVTLKINTRAYSKKGLDIAYKRVMSKRKLK